MSKIIVADLTLQDRAIVHILRAGIAICGFSNQLPNDWPDGHLWVAATEIANVTCPECLDITKEPRSRTIKQIIVVRTDLNMRKGKMITQGAHASGMFEKLAWIAGIPPTTLQREWITEGQTKICVRCGSETELLDIEAKATAAGLTVHLITDAGRTEFHGVPTKTCLAIGPNVAADIDMITGSLKPL